jgi:hypothetical protein
MNLEIHVARFQVIETGRFDTAQSKIFFIFQPFYSSAHHSAQKGMSHFPPRERKKISPRKGVLQFFPPRS